MSARVLWEGTMTDDVDGYLRPTEFVGLGGKVRLVLDDDLGLMAEYQCSDATGTLKWDDIRGLPTAADDKCEPILDGEGAACCLAEFAGILAAAILDLTRGRK